MNEISRRDFLNRTALIAGGSTIIPLPTAAAADVAVQNPQMQFGLVTYLWGKDMDLPTLIDVCEKAEILGVETRTEHKHGVEPSLSKFERTEVKKRFTDSPVTLVGYGSNAQYHESDPAKVKANIELTKQYIRLMHDCGGSGVKVKPNGFPKNVSRQQTIEQIGKSLNEVASYGQEYGQQIRVEVHGKGTQEIDAMKAIFEVADHSNATICWNSNDADLNGKGLKQNFNLLKDRFGATVHVREFNVGDYPYPQLIKLFQSIKYNGWILLEARTNPKDKIAALIEQRQQFEKLLSN
ncbi:MAG: sugar phosphate isomerase/epimerase family protein [Rubripirellula sp.]